MKLTCGIIQIIKVEKNYGVTVHVSGTVSTLGTYKSLRGAVEKPLEDAQISPAARSALEEIRKKGDAAAWDEEEVFRTLATAHQ